MGNRISESDIAPKIERENYYHDDELTICVLTLKNGFKSVGVAICAHPRDYDRSVGERKAFDRALYKLYGMEAYHRCENYRMKKQ